MTTSYHARYFAYELTRRGVDGVERISQSLFDACVDLNPHQVEAALFAIRSPISKGVLLADEVGLGKTIEAGLVLTQFWAEKRRRLLVICPAALRKQWALELEEKFNLPAKIIDAKAYREGGTGGSLGPFDADAVVITSMHYASGRSGEIRAIPWDLVVIDEAHKLRNAYRESNRLGQSIRWALEERRKILLTATPLQNSLLELYGLTSIIDDTIFGDLPSFRTQYVGMDGDVSGLRDRLQPFCHRTLRRQVLEYIQYTERRLLTRPFEPTENEQRLYEAVSEFLQRADTYAIPHRQRHLTTLIVRKLLASSPHAVAGTLEAMRNRLIRLRDEHKDTRELWQRIVEDEDIEEEILDELLEDAADAEGTDQAAETDGGDTEVAVIDTAKLNKEIEELGQFSNWARSIGIDTKARALVTALKVGFEKMAEMEAPRKAVIFTESRRTQGYLKGFLEANGYAGQVAVFNGTNNDPQSTEIYTRWVEANKDSGRATGSKSVDMRTALIEHFRDQGTLLIATEAGAEGINLQFCSLVVNFDLPWNPQRIEQRIGRCHRYGQKHDVVVINFLNSRNAADQRVHELLEHKFRLFTGVFGASDDVLGAVESGVDFERRVLDIYQQCRSRAEIDSAFKTLQAELDEQINQKMEDTRRSILENFDEEVHDRLRANLAGTKQQLDRIGQIFWSLTRFVLSARATFNDSDYTFDLKESPIVNVHPGRYHMISKNQQNVPGEFLYRLSHPLGEYVLEQGKALVTPSARVEFDISCHPVRIAMIEQLKGQTGWLVLQRLVIDSFDREEYLLFSAFTDDGKNLDQESCEKLFHCSGTVVAAAVTDNKTTWHLEAEAERHIRATVNRSLETNNLHFQQAREQLERWADDMVVAAEKELQDTKEQIKVLTRQTRQAPTLEEQRVLLEKTRELEAKKRRQRQQIFEVEDQIAEKRDRLIDQLEARMTQKSKTESLFTLRWQVV